MSLTPRAERWLCGRGGQLYVWAEPRGFARWGSEPPEGPVVEFTTHRLGRVAVHCAAELSLGEWLRIARWPISAGGLRLDWDGQHRVVTGPVVEADAVARLVGYLKRKYAEDRKADRA